MGGTVTQNNTTNQTNTSTSTQQTTSNTSWTPPSGSTLYNDRVKVSADQYLIQDLLESKSMSTSQLSSLQAQYNKDLATYSSDLDADVAGIHSASSALGRPNFSAQQQAEINFDDAEKDSINGKSHDQNYYQLTFTDSTAGSSHASGTVPADAFPGGEQDPEWFGDQNLQKGYVTPPAISAGSDISTVYNNLDSNQAAYLGWALQEEDAGKQVEIPTQDLQSWNLLSEYAKQNNKELGTGNPDSSKDGIDDVDDKVESSFTTNQKTDPATTVKEAFAGIFTLGLPTSLSHIIPGQAGQVLGNLAGAAAAAVVGVGLGGELGAAGVSGVSGGLAGGIADAASLLTSLKNVVTAGGVSEAGTALLEELDGLSANTLNGGADGFSLNDNYNKNYNE